MPLFSCSIWTKGSKLPHNTRWHGKKLVAKRTCSLALHHHHLAKLRLSDFWIHFSLWFLLTVFRRFHEKWREATVKNSEIFWHHVKSHLLSFVCILPKECCRPLPRCQKISLFLIMVSRHFPWKRRKTVRRKSNTASYLVNTSFWTPLRGVLNPILGPLGAVKESISPFIRINKSTNADYSSLIINKVRYR